MERLRRHYLVPLLTVLILFLFGLALLLGVVRRVRQLRSEAVFVGIPLRPEATAAQRLLTPAATYPPYTLDLLPAAMRRAEPEADLRGRVENLALTLTAPVPTVPGGPTWTPTAPATPTAISFLNCTIVAEGAIMYSAPDVTSAVSGQLSGGEMVEGTGRLADSQWLIANTTTGQQGWLDAALLACEQPINALGIVEP
ncbi:MAG: hypothetical protein KDE59_14995 [Anaerolineales bacterium]|nr:hypothetical protein [Anaerolineales bacterium]MCB0028851.1 hypothetical protein [Anaerolineales bacterium]